MDLLARLSVILLFPFNYLTIPDSQYFLPTYLAAGATALIIRMGQRRRWFVSLRTVRALLLPQRLLQHPSSLLDAKMFFIGLYYLVFQVLLVGGTTLLSVAGTVSLLSAWFGPAHIATAGSWPVTLATMVLVFLAVEFGYWLSHYLMHKVPFLWEFHKVHHSAEVLTPLTEWRQHPVELALFPVLMGGAACLVQGPMVWWFGAGAQVIDPMRANLISMAFWYTILHLRHTELPLYLTGVWGKIIQSPAHHQVHHSTNPKHYDTNMGYCLSLFDWIFGTLYVPQKGEKFDYGLGHKDDALETAMGSVFAPIGRVVMMAAGALGLLARQRPASSAPE